MEKRLLYPGCLVLACLQDYELSAKAVLKKLGVELEDMHEFACCSSSIVPSFTDDWINLAAYNLALAETRRMDIVTLCGSCTRTLKHANQFLLEDPERMKDVNGRLAEIGMHYGGTVRINHIIEVMHERRGVIEDMEKVRVENSVALTHPCNVIRPSKMMQFDDPWQPKKMREIIELAGVTVVDYEKEFECCGSSLLLSDEQLAIGMAKEKLRSAMEAGADTMVVSCGNCYLLLEKFQHKITATSPELALPIMFLPQLIGQAMGIPRAELGLKQ